VKWTVADAPDCVVECRVFAKGPALEIDVHDPEYATCEPLSSKEPFDMGSESEAQDASVALVQAVPVNVDTVVSPG